MARQERIRAGALAATAGLAVLAPVLLATSASAHVPTWTTACDRISVTLTTYDAKFHNTVSLTLDGQKLLDQKKFDESFSQDFVVPAHTKDLKAVLMVVTDQDPKGENGWTVTKTATIAPCVPTTSPSPSPSPSHSSSSPTPSHSVTPTPTVKPSTSRVATPSPSPTGPQLASTGGGSDAPVIAGAGAGVIAIGGGLLFLGRRRQSRRH